MPSTTASKCAKLFLVSDLVLDGRAEGSIPGRGTRFFCFFQDDQDGGEVSEAAVPSQTNPSGNGSGGVNGQTAPPPMDTTVRSGEGEGAPSGLAL